MPVAFSGVENYAPVTSAQASGVHAVQAIGDTGVVVGGILTPSQIFGTNLKHGYQGKNPSNVQAAGQWTSWFDAGQAPVLLNGANKPLVVSAGINGEDSASFISSSQLFFQTASTLALSQPFTVGLIIKPSAVIITGNDRFWVCQDGGGAADIRYNDQASPYISIHAGTDTITANALVDGNVMAVMAHFEGASSFITINHGAQIGLGTDIGSAGFTMVNVGLSPGADPNFDANGLLSEIWFPTGASTQAQYNQFQAYLCKAAGV